MTDYLLSARELIARVKSSAEEFIVVVVLMFWTYGEQTISLKNFIHKWECSAWIILRCSIDFIFCKTIIKIRSGDMSISENIIRIGEKYRGLIEKELHAYYRDELKLDNYAARMGELMMIIQTFEVRLDHYLEKNKYCRKQGI